MPHEPPKKAAKRAEPPMLATAWLCHQTSGRFRARVPERRGDDAYFARVKEALEQHDATVEVVTNPVTASILVLHRGNSADLLSYAETAGLFRATTEGPAPATVARWLDKLDRFDTEVLFARIKENPQRAATGLFMLAVFQALRGSVLPSAPTLLGEAMRLLRQWHEKQERSESGEP
jgi:hypothetical protein